MSSARVSETPTTGQEKSIEEEISSSAVRTKSVVGRRMDMMILWNMLHAT